MKILITGVGGFIGSSLMREFLRLGHHVIGLYRRTHPVIDKTEKALLVKCDLTQPIEVRDKVDVVIHSAAHTPATEQLQSQTIDYINSNIIGTSSLINVCKKIQPKLFVYLSSVSIYGKVKVSILDEETPFHEPELYGATKYVGELILAGASEFFPVISVRLPGVVGKNYFISWFGRVFRKALEGEDILIYNPSSLFNNVTDPIELLNFILNLARQDFIGYEVVNFAAGQPIALMKLVEMTLSRLNSKSKIFISREERHSFWINVEKLIKRFNFFPTNTVKVIDRYISQNANLLSNTIGYSKSKVSA